MGQFFQAVVGVLVRSSIGRETRTSAAQISQDHGEEPGNCLMVCFETMVRGVFYQWLFALLGLHNIYRVFFVSTFNHALQHYNSLGQEVNIIISR